MHNSIQFDCDTSLHAFFNIHFVRNQKVKYNRKILDHSNDNNILYFTLCSYTYRILYGNNTLTCVSL